LFTAHGKEAGTTHGKVSRMATAKHTAASWGTAMATMHGSELGHGSDMTHGSELGHGSVMTHGSECTHGKVPGRTAANARTAMCLDARQRMPAWQRAWTHGNVLHARQSSLPSHFGETHGKVFVAEPGFAVPVLPCVDARQCLCRAILCLCRAICPHGKALFSGSALNQKIAWPVDCCAYW
jgi:hypothetical protein